MTTKENDCAAAPNCSNSTKLATTGMQEIAAIYCCILSNCCLNDKLHVVVLQRTTRNCSKVRASRAARLFFLIRPITLLALSLLLLSSLLKFYLCKCLKRPRRSLSKGYF